MKIDTWKDLKDYLGTLNEEQLSKMPTILVDDTHYTISLADFNEYDVVWNEEMDEGSIPVDEYVEEHYGFPLEDDRNLLMPKGTIPMVYAD